jgi:hypothetical protein
LQFCYIIIFSLRNIFIDYLNERKPMSAIGKAQKDERIQKLIQEIKKAGIQISYKRSEERDSCWGSDMEDGVATIFYDNCKAPVEACAHELLHIDAQLRGYRRIRIGFSTYDRTYLFPRFMTCLDNELQHHKIYNSFISLGFEPGCFYCDSDTEIEQYIKKVLIDQNRNLLQVIPDFFSTIAPGGSLSETTKDELVQSFYNLNGGQYKSTLETIKEVVNNWGTSESYDNLPVIRDIMLGIQPSPNYTWFGFNENERPPQGFFVDQIFDPKKI